MSKKDTQRKTLAMLVLFFIAYIYVEKVANPYLMPQPVKEDSQKDSSAPLEKQKEVGVDAPVFSQDLPKANIQNGSLVSEKTVSGSETIKSTDQAQPISPPSSALVESEGLISLESDVLKLKISKLGGRIVSLQLKEYRRDNPKDEDLIEMISYAEGMSYPGGLILSSENDLYVRYDATLVNSSGQESELSDTNLFIGDASPELKLRLSGLLSSGSRVVKEFTIKKDSYLFDFSAKVQGDSPAKVFVEWSKYVDPKDTSFFDPYDTDGFVWYNGDRSERLTYNEMNDAQQKRSFESLSWLGLGNKYFASALVYKNGIETSDTASNGKVIFPTLASIEKSGNYARALFGSKNESSEIALHIYSGPKSYRLLDDIGFELKRLLDLGKTGLISAPLLALLNLFYAFVGNYGLAIVLLTIAVKLCLYPLNSTQFKQMKALQALKPELDRIKENIKDRQQQQQALMELYKKKGVNPLGGCLPVLVQMPIFIGLYSALMLSVELRHAPFGMWVQDLSAPDSLMIGGIGIPVLVVLFTASMMVQQWITPTTIDPAQKKAMMIMPLVMFFMFMGFPAGLALYWLTNNLFSIGQQQAIQYNDKHGKSGFKITAMVAVGVFAVSWLCTLF